MKEYDLVRILAQDGIMTGIEKYGLEGVEDVIKSAYKSMPKLRDYMLKEYYYIIKGK